MLGLEREWVSKPAGLRTYALVCEGSALFMMCSLLLGQEMRKAGSTTYDPSRIASTVVQGIGFLAGGVILARGSHEFSASRPRPTFGSRPPSASSFGAGFFFIAIAATLCTIVILGPVKWVEDRLNVRNQTRAKEAELMKYRA